ncbi:MAG TPA: GNAT family N-acetyltransferase [Bacteroidetes bacterium]|nr:GNAT family N-acetyltransferase [Bacteroidota bacterium]
MEDIIPPVPRELILKELTPDKFVRKTNKGNNEVYIFTYRDSPNLMQELGRLREISFREAGGGTGKSLDIDEFDIGDHPYKQLIVWDPEAREILGGYRFFICRRDIDLSWLATSHLFRFSNKFIREYLPYLVELGRSFVQPHYQQTGKSARKGIFALDNLWDGLGAVVIDNPGIKYFFGKMTMYPHFKKEARDLILYFLDKYFGDHEGLVIPINPLKPEYDEKEMEKIFSGKDYFENYKILSQAVRNLGENIPPLFNSYMNLSPTMKIFGTVINDEFGDVEETGLMITLKDLYIDKVNRHLTTYNENYRLDEV